MSAQMPLFEMSHNVQEPESLGRKRSHDEYASDAVKTENTDEKSPTKAAVRPTGDARKSLST